MDAIHAPALRDLHPLRAAPRPRAGYAWILEDPELTPRKPRAEVPLSAWA